MKLGGGGGGGGQMADGDVTVTIYL